MRVSLGKYTCKARPYVYQKSKHAHGFSSMKITARHKGFPFTISILQLLEKFSFWATALSSTAWYQPGGPGGSGGPAWCARRWVTHLLRFTTGSSEPTAPFVCVLCPPSRQMPIQVLIAIPESKRRKKWGKKWAGKNDSLLAAGFRGLKPAIRSRCWGTRVRYPAVAAALCSLSLPHHFLSGLKNLSSAVD